MKGTAVVLSLILSVVALHVRGRAVFWRRLSSGNRTGRPSRTGHLSRRNLRDLRPRECPVGRRIQGRHVLASIADHPPGAAINPGIVTDIREWPCGEFSVWGIEVRDPRFRTKGGIGIGSTEGELRRAYSFHITEAEGAHAAMVDALKMSFSLSREAPVEQQRVTSVWIWPIPRRFARRGAQDVAQMAGNPTR